MKLLVLSLLVAAAAASPLLGSERCTWGPSYWCSHIKAAKECNAVQHCISTVWKNQKLPAVTDGKSGELCQFCEDTMKEVLNKVKGGEKEILAYLEQACSIIPDSGLAAQCKSMVDEFFPQIMQMVIAELDPKTICTAVGFCTQGFKPKPEAKVQGQKPLDNILGHVQLIKTQSKAVSHTLNFEPAHNVKVFNPKDTSGDKKASPSEQCEMCKLAVAELKKITTDEAKQQEIETFIEKYLCGNIGSIKDECDKLVVQYGPLIFQFLAQEIDPETLCKAIGLCTSMKKPLMSLLKETNGVQSMSQVPMQMMSPAAKKLTVRSSTQCVVCEFLISKLESELKDNATEQEIIDAVNKGCSYLPSTIAKECQALVKEYGAVIISLLVNDVDAEKVCTLIGLCKPSKRVPKYVFGTEACVLCETMAMYLQALLKEKNTEIAIRQELERVCNFLPDTEAAICDGLLVMYGDKIVLALANEISAKDICQFIDVCPKSKSYQAPKLVKELQVNVKSIEFCPICELVVTKIDEFLKENSTEAMVVEALDKVCSYMPATVKVECDDFVKQYGPMVVKLLALQIVPKDVCTKLGLCTKTTQAKKAVEKFQSAVSCEVCQLAAGYLDALLEKNSTETQIEAALNQLCGYLPSSVKSECDALVKQYGPIIIKLMVQELSPSLICKELGLCISQKAVATPKPHLLGAEKCTWGPSYWCTNFDNAKKCNAVEHCNKHVWKNEV
ncbi:prosaposin-like isoform X3 [Lineus longissimus]|uniref:prosaposin-like isoform X3 n=1 Tax=Lineus longissimus TaxID=88925 RepID=UPI00315D58BE